MSEYDGPIVTVDLTVPELSTMVGIIQVEKKRARSRNDETLADQLGTLQSKLIEAKDEQLD